MSREGLTAFDDLRTAPLNPIAGWKFPYNVNADIVNTYLTGSGTVTHSAPRALLNTTAATDSAAQINTRRVMRYLPGIGGLLRCTATFTEPVAGSRQFIGLTNGTNALADSADTLAVGFNGTAFGIMQKRSGATVADSFIPLTNIAGDPPDLNYTNGNVFWIQYQWLGYGPVRFGYETPTGEFKPYYLYKNPSASVETSLVDPSVYVFARAENTTNDSAITVGTPSGMAFREGGNPDPLDPLTLIRGFVASKTISAEVPVLSIRTPATYQGRTCLISPRIGAISLSADGTKNVVFRIYRGATLTGASAVDYNVNVSALQSDTSATAFTGGELVFAYTLGKTDSFVGGAIGLDAFELEPNEWLTITAQSTSSNDVTVTLLVEEPF